MGPTQAIKTGLAKSFQFKGRATRSEFWWFTLAAFGLFYGAEWLENTAYASESYDLILLAGNFVTALGLVLILPFLSVTVRRFHDVGLSGWWVALIWVGTFVTSGMALFRQPISLTAVETSGFDISLDTPFILLLATQAIFLITEIVICLWPGNGHTNQYGQLPFTSESNPHEVPA